MTVLKVVIFCVFAVFSVKSLPLDENPSLLDFSSEETNEVGDKEYKGYSGIRTISRLDDEKEFVVFKDKVIWYEARDICLNKGMTLASPETYVQILKLRSYLRDNDLVPADIYSGYWVGGRRNSGEAPFTWQYSEKRVEPFGWLPDAPKDAIGEDCIEFKNRAGLLGLSNRHCYYLRGYICERTLPQESRKNREMGMNDKIHEETMKYIVQDLLQRLNSISSISDETGSISSATDETDSASSSTIKTDSDSSASDETVLDSSTTEDISDDWGRTPPPSMYSPESDYEYSYDDADYY